MKIYSWEDWEQIISRHCHNDNLHQEYNLKCSEKARGRFGKLCATREHIKMEYFTNYDSY